MSVPAVPVSSLPLSLPQTPALADVDHAAIATSFLNNLKTLSTDHFVKDSYWRDLLALTGTFRTFSSPKNIINSWHDTTKKHPISDLKLVPDSSSYRPTPALSWIQALFTFKSDRTPTAICSGILRVVQDADGQWKIWILTTILEELEGLGNPDNLSIQSQQRASSHISQHLSSKDFECVVIGAGQAGLSTLASLKALGVRAIALERHSELGGNWLARYDSIALHTTREMSQMPFGRFFTSDDNYYLTGKELARGYKKFAEECDLEVWCSANVEKAVWDESSKKWTVEITKNGKCMTVESPHVVFAVGGFGSVPKMPKLPSQDAYKGEVMHSVGFKNGNAWKGKKGIVIGSGTTAHDIAYDLYASGLSSVTMVQRGPTAMILEPYMRYAWDPVFNEKSDIRLADRELNSLPTVLSRFFANASLQGWAEQHAHLFEALERTNFKFERYPDVFHHLFERSGGHYVDIGNATPKIADGSIKLKHSLPTSFTPTCLQFDDSTSLDADVVIFCTGFETNMRIAISKIVGDELAAKAGDYGEFDREGEMRNQWKRTGQEGLWYAGGTINQSRYYSRFLALQIKAAVEGCGLEVYDGRPGDDSDGVGGASRAKL